MPRGKLAVLTAVFAVLVHPADAHAVTALGHDVSWPQCDTTTPSLATSLPTTGDFGIVGVTGSKPYSDNPCRAAEWTWASSATASPAVYTTTANPDGSSQFYGYPDADPRPCGTDKTAAGCAYNYGWNAAAYSLGLTSTMSGAATADWWLDVETANSWAGGSSPSAAQQMANVADLQGFRDYLLRHGVPHVGVYSNATAWGPITGSFSRAKAASYRAAWGFSPYFPLEDSPLWLAGGGSDSDAAARCPSGFMPGQVLLSQYTDGSFDGDAQCATLDTTKPTATITGPSSIYTLGSTVSASFTGADQGGAGLASFDVRYTRYLPDSSAGQTFYPTAWQRTSAHSVSLTATPGATYCFSVRARDGVGNDSAWTGTKCTMTPLDDRALTRSSGWVQSSATSAYLKTLTSSSTNGASLTRKSLYTKRLVLVVTKCSTCGSVRVYLGSTLWATVSLKTTSGTAYRQLITLKAPSLASRTVTIKVYGSGHSVRIDGLLTSRI